MGLICRTASMSVSTETLIEEAHELLKIWEDIQEKFSKHSEPALLFRESDLIKKALLTAVNKKFNRILIDDYQTFEHCKALYQKYRPAYEA